MICVSVPRDSGHVLEEARYRVQAELRAAGFRVESVADDAQFEHAPQCEEARGFLSFQVSDEQVEVDALASLGVLPLTQRMDLSAPTTTPEVVAIRAVEGLRAALIQEVRESEKKRREQSKVVLSFTRLEADRPTGVRRPEPQQQQRARGAAQRGGKRVDAPMLFSLGPTLGVGGGTPGLGVELAATWRLPWVYFGGLIDASVVPEEWSVPSGTATFRQYSLLVRGGLRLPCGSSVECQLGAAMGLRQISIDAEAADPNWERVAENHGSALLAGDLLFAFFPGGPWGVGGSARLGGLVDAPRVSMGTAVVSWGRPFASGSLLVFLKF